MFGCDWGDARLRLKHGWKPVFAIVSPVLLLPIGFGLPFSSSVSNPDDPEKKFRAAYVIAVMAVFWITEVIPMAVTSLIPLVLFPLLRIQDACAVSKNYMKESNMIFLGAIMIALAIEYCGLHIRGALNIISIFGAKPPRIMLATMIITAALSMWLSDTSCTTMILPILSAITSAMFREEQTEIVLDDDEEELTNEPNIDIPKHFHTRRVSNVFANAAFEGRMNQVLKQRRNSRRSTDGSIRRRPMSLSQGRSQRSHEGSLRNTIAISHVNPSIDDEVAERSLQRDGETAPSTNGSVRHIKNMGVIIEGEAEPTDKNDTKTLEETEESEESNHDLADAEVQSNIRKMLLFAVAYSANIGGTGSLVGTGPVKVFKELNKQHLNHDKKANFAQVSFTTWMAFTIPTITVNIGLVWLFLTIRYYGFRNLFKKTSEYNSKKDREKVRAYLDEEFKKLGPITAHEIGVLFVFIFIVLLWLTRDPQLFDGWDSLITTKKSKSGDSTPAMFAAILLFVIPRKWNFLNFSKPFKATAPKYEPLLDWKFVSTNAPWGYILLIGSGYAISDASDKSGLSEYIGKELVLLGALSPKVLLLIVVVLTSVITEVASNTACATLILPILFSVSCELKMHPTYLTMAAAISASYAFMLPISSPPNAIVFATGELSIKEMISNGFFLNNITIINVKMLAYARTDNSKSTMITMTIVGSKERYIRSDIMSCTQFEFFQVNIWNSFFFVAIFAVFFAPAV